MKKNIIKLIAAALAIVALVLILGELPNASMVHFAAVKIFGTALLWAAAKLMECVTQEEII